MSIHNYWRTLQEPQPIDETSTIIHKASQIKHIKPGPPTNAEASFDGERDFIPEEDSVAGVNQIDPGQLLLMNQRKRIEDWSDEATTNIEYVRALRDGIYGGKSVHTHKFRDEKKSKHLSSKPFISRNYEPAKLRAKHAEEDFKGTHLEFGTLALIRRSHWQ